MVTRGVGAVFEVRRAGGTSADADGPAIVASLLITYEWGDWRNGMVWWIQSVYVVPSFRGRIYAKAITFVKAAVRPFAGFGCMSSAECSRRSLSEVGDGWGALPRVRVDEN
jgi:hypothetical protein